MKPTRTLFLAAILWSCARIAARGEEPVRRIEDVIYGQKFGMALTMDVFQPAKPNGCGILFLVNGGWFSSKATPLMVTIQPDNYRPFLERGFTVFAVVTSSQPGARGAGNPLRCGRSTSLSGQGSACCAA